MSDTRNALCNTVDGSVLMGHMRELARWVKLSGTPDELASLRYFQARMDDYGYRSELLLHDAYISLPGAARVDVDNQALTSITHSFSRTSPPGGVTGRLVYIGDGEDADFAGKDLRGAIVLTEGIASPGQAARSSHAGPSPRPWPICPAPWSAPCRTTTAECYATGWPAASSRASHCTPRWTPAGARRRSWSPTWTDPRRTVRSFCSPVITTPGITA
jgi:hypothetical protein